MGSWWIGAIALFALAGCAGQPLVYNTQISPSYRPTEYGYGAGQRDFTTDIHGNPFSGNEQEFDTAFVALLNRHQPILQATHFTLTPGPDARPLYRAVYLLNYANSIPDHICRKRLDIEPVDLGSTVRVIAAFCRRESYLSTVTGEVEAESIDDPKFDNLIAQINLLLFPPVDPSRSGRPLWWLVGGLEADAGEVTIRLASEPVAGG